MIEQSTQTVGQNTENARHASDLAGLMTMFQTAGDAQRPAVAAARQVMLA